jgi:hypothetical protein
LESKEEECDLYVKIFDRGKKMKKKKNKEMLTFCKKQENVCVNARISHLSTLFTRCCSHHDLCAFAYLNTLAGLGNLTKKKHEHHLSRMTSGT